MEQELFNLKESVLKRKKAWQKAINPKIATSVFVCNHRIQKLDEALELIAKLELIDEYTMK